jgi:nucleoside-diphosphate-sugar epimerase
MTQPAPYPGPAPVLLSLGHGYVAGRLAVPLLAAGWQVIGTRRDPAAARALRATGVEGAVWPGTPSETLLARATHVLTSVPPQGGADPVVAAAGGAIAQARHLRWVGYLSTTGVYGDHSGGWVDEDTPCAPQNPRARARVAAEAAWREICDRAGVPLHVFRLPGIYGPGRSPFAALRSGTARRIVKPGQVFSRIHADDIAAALIASMQRPDAGGAVYNLADGCPAPPQDVVAEAARLIGLLPPSEERIEDAALSPMAAEFYAECKRVRSDRLRERLGWVPRYPDYRAGLAACLAEEQGKDN